MGYLVVFGAECRQCGSSLARTRPEAQSKCAKYGVLTNFDAPDPLELELGQNSTLGALPQLDRLCCEDLIKPELPQSPVTSEEWGQVRGGGG
jgi:hypothetical protein